MRGRRPVRAWESTKGMELCESYCRYGCLLSELREVLGNSLERFAARPHCLSSTLCDGQAHLR